MSREKKINLVKKLILSVPNFESHPQTNVVKSDKSLGTWDPFFLERRFPCFV